MAGKRTPKGQNEPERKTEPNDAGAEIGTVDQPDPLLPLRKELEALAEQHGQIRTFYDAILNQQFDTRTPWSPEYFLGMTMAAMAGSQTGMEPWIVKQQMKQLYLDYRSTCDELRELFPVDEPQPEAVTS